MDSATQHIDLPDEAVEDGLHRGLKQRHIQLIAIGGAIASRKSLLPSCRRRRRPRRWCRPRRSRSDN